MIGLQILHALQDFKITVVQLLSIERGCVTCKNQIHSLNVKVAEQRSKVKIGHIEHVLAINSYALTDFEIIWYNC